MIVIPALDLREGACVQLESGEYDRERIRMPNPVGVAKGWAQLGFNLLHLVDLDAATERGNNDEIVRDIIRDASLPVQVGGGVRDADTIERLLADGARNVVVGTRALENPDWLAYVAASWGGRLIVAADVRDRNVLSRGWQRTLTRHITDVIEELNDLPLASIMVTAVHRDGQLAGTDLPLMEDVARASDHPVLASGGISTMSELRSLADTGIAGAIVGMALYTGTLNPRVVAEEFGVDSGE
ncbi:MAG: 1-(5-phosphoribosyl)-5-[(5-phosphoribosylamino)methylideneamino] imidazole-4-carboxamide isomerase [Anaerolineae bacterium]|nr:1-(5-phosphoribosyl)-5-[(5-phosphoribosylamino)methylideneamino] imidazole-4-carboxamide isomerase [Gemmatimonadaceae bacterium]